MVEIFESSQQANFTFNAINKKIVLDDDFVNLVASYLKKINLNPNCIKNYLTKGGVYLLDIKNKNKSNKVLRSGKITDIDIIRCGENLILEDDGIDIICNWNGYFVLIQCKYCIPCEACSILKINCKHVYSKLNIINDVKKLDEKLNKYKKGLAFGIFVVNNEINIDFFNEEEENQFENIIKITKFNTNKFLNIINEIGQKFLFKYIKKEKKIKKNKEKYKNYDYTNNEAEIIYNKFENLMKENINNFSNNFFQIIRLILNYVRENNIDNTISRFNDLNV